MKKTKGFTLLELLVVIAIIGLISTFAVVQLNSGRQKARDAKRISDMKQLQTALEFYYDDNDSYLMAAPCNASFPDRIYTCTSLSSYIPAYALLKDPSGSTTACATTSTADCDYALGTASVSAYRVDFHLEAASSLGNTGADACSLTQDGLSCP
ncbi:MAG: type II secretion system protein [Candidatus Komeilibacteria bacterium]